MFTTAKDERRRAIGAFVNEHWLAGVALVYLILVVAGTAFIELKPGPRRGSMGLIEIKDQVEIKAKPEGIWTPAYEYVRAPALLKIEASDDEWEYAPGKKCKADGDRNSLLHSQDLIAPGAPAGALIAKVGGSTAGINDGRIFVVGKLCLLQLDQSGPLFLTVNDQVSGLESNSGSIKVKISLVPMAQVSSAVPSPGVTPPSAGNPSASPPIPGPLPGPPMQGGSVPGTPVQQIPRTPGERK